MCGACSGHVVVMCHWLSVVCVFGVVPCCVFITVVLCGHLKTFVCCLLLFVLLWLHPSRFFVVVVVHCGCCLCGVVVSIVVRCLLFFVVVCVLFVVDICLSWLLFVCCGCIHVHRWSVQVSVKRSNYFYPSFLFVVVSCVGMCVTGAGQVRGMCGACAGHVFCHRPLCICCLYVVVLSCCMFIAVVMCCGCAFIP
jgi:hypothetical protein